MTASFIEIYRTDWGDIRLKPSELEAKALQQTRAMWSRHADDLIGVPEIEPDNADTLRRMTDRAYRKYMRRAA